MVRMLDHMQILVRYEEKRWPLFKAFSFIHPTKWVTLGCENFYCVAHAHPHFKNWSARTSAPHLNFWWLHPQPHSHFFKKNGIFHHSLKNKNFLFNRECSHYILLYSYKSFCISRFLEFNRFKTSFLLFLNILSCFQTFFPVSKHPLLFLNDLF